MNRKIISIITATLNSEKHIERCLNSIASQTAIKSIEHIIIDGKSNDKTIEIASRYEHLSKIISENDTGIYNAFNKGVKNATGEIIYFLGSDDWLANENTIKEIIDIFEKKPELDYVAGKIFLHDEELNYSSKHESRFLNINNQKIPHPPHQGFFIKRNKLIDYGCFSECFKIISDSYIMLKAIKEENGVLIPNIIAHFSTSGISNSNENADLLSREQKALYLLLNLNKENNLPNNRAKSHENFNSIKEIIKNKEKIKIKNKKILLFGTRDLSISLYKLLFLGSNERCFYGFLTSNGGNDFLDKRVYSISDLKGDELIINCIEGEHHDQVEEKIKQHNSKTQVVDWKQIIKLFS